MTYCERHKVVCAVGGVVQSPVFPMTAWGLIRHEVFDTFVARPNGLFTFLFLPESLIHFTREAGTEPREPEPERNLARR
jgi:hypothetical protein